MTDAQHRREALEVAIARGGGILAFARSLGITHQAVTSWRKRGRVPLARALMIEHLYGVAREHMVDPVIAEVFMAPAAPADPL